MLKIVNAPNAVLSSVAKPVLKVDSSILNLIEDMKQALNNAKDPKGVGLAAPQVGKSLQIFLVKPTENSKIQVFINPVLISSSKQPAITMKKPKAESQKSSVRLEGCLSLQDIWGEVKRSPSIKISYLNEKGEKEINQFRGLMAIIVQHEMDHLNGVLFPKRVLEQNGNLYRSHKNEKGEDEFDEIDI